MQARLEITVVTDVSLALTSGSLPNQKTKLSSPHGKKRLKYMEWPGWVVVVVQH